MDSFIFDFNTETTLINDENNSQTDLDWTAFQSTPPLSASSSSPSSVITTNAPFKPVWLSQQDDAVAPNNQLTTITPPPTANENEIYVDIERFFNGFNHHQQQMQQQIQVQPIQQQDIIEPIHVNINISDQTMNEGEPIESPSRPHVSLVLNERPMSRVSSSSRSQCYHKLPDRAVKLMQEWYNANLDDPYPRSPDKKRFITEGNITAQQCRSWFANRRQRLKHVKKNLSKSSSSRSHPYLPAKSNQSPSSSSVETSPIPHEHCYYCQQQQQQQPMAFSSSSASTSPTTTTTTLNVVINQQTVEQLIHNSLRKLLYPALM